MTEESKLISDARTLFDDSVAWTDDIRKKFKYNAEFVLFNKQWDKSNEAVRKARGRPALTFNVLQSFSLNVLNVNLSQRPGVAIRPADQYGDEKAAQLLMSICRGIERNSNADIAYRRSLINLILCGYSFIELKIKHKHPLSFEREIVISEVLDPRNVVADLSAIWSSRKPSYAFHVHFLTEKEFEAEYPNDNMVSFCEESDEIGYAPFDGNKCQLVDYWTRKKTDIEILKLRRVNPLSGEQESHVMRRDQMLNEGKAYLLALGQDPKDWSNDDALGLYLSATQSEIEATRQSYQYEVIKKTLSGDRVLSEEVFPGEDIPLVMGHMDLGLVENQFSIMDLISPLIDTQEMLNYSMSKLAEQSGKSLQSMVIGPQGFIPRGQESQWDPLNMKDRTYQEYDTAAGPPPELWNPPPTTNDPVPEMSWEYLQHISGRYASQMGAPSNEISGVAINKREEQGQNTSSSLRIAFSNQSIELYKIMIPLVVDVYQDHDRVETVNEAESSEILTKPLQRASQKEGVDLRKASWNMTVVKGPPFSTQQEEAVTKIIELAKLNPEILQIAGDLIVSNMRFTGSDVLQKRIKSLLPEAIKESERVTSDEEDDPQSLKMRLGELSVQNKGLTEEVEKLTQLNQELSSASALIQEKERIQYELKQAELQLKEKETEAKLATEKTLKEEQIIADREKFDQELEFKATQNELDRRHELERIMLSKQAECAEDSEITPAEDFDQQEEIHDV